MTLSGFSEILKYMGWDTHIQQKHKLTHQKKVKEVGSSHKDAPDASLPVHASSGPTAQMSQV